MGVRAYDITYECSNRKGYPVKVGGSGKSGATTGPKKSSPSKGEADVNFSAYVTGGADETSQASATQSIAQLDSLLAVQQTEDPMQKQSKKRMQQRANTILDKLEGLRVKMLTGDLTVGHMVDVADVVASHREKIDDPALTAIMDEVDLRAQVELAKMRYALDA